MLSSIRDVWHFEHHCVMDIPDIRQQRVNPLTAELNPCEQRCLPEFFTGAFKF